MGYSAVRGRKPFERASKISHAEVIKNPRVEAFLASCAIPEAADVGVIPAQPAPPLAATSPIRIVVAIDGGYTETAVRERYPSASITFFTFGPLMFEISDLRALDRQPFIAPEDLARLKKIQRFSLVLPTRNVTRRGLSLSLSIRQTIHEFFESEPAGESPLIESFRWLLFRQWAGNPISWTLPRCPNPNCAETAIALTAATPSKTRCAGCGGPIFLIDTLRLHERIDDDLGAGGVLAYVMNVLEHVVLVHLVRAMWLLKPDLLKDVLLIKDGPLAFFGTTAPLSAPMRELAAFLGSGGGLGQAPLLNVVGLEKSGAFVDHAAQIDDRLSPGSVVLLSNDYIYKHIVPGDPNAPDPYGKNTYWGGKLIFKASDASMYVATIPTAAFTPNPTLADFIGISPILDTLASLRCSMYDNALVPIALVNKLVSLADYPSARLLETFARHQLAG